MQFANINTNEIKNILPSILVLDGKTITGADIRHWSNLGWCKVVQVDQPAEGYRVGSYLVDEVDELTCILRVATQINIADEQAQQAAEEAALALQQIKNDKDTAKLLSDVATTPTGRVIRAFAALVLIQINALRTKTGMATFTEKQFIDALKAEIEAQA